LNFVTVQDAYARAIGGESLGNSCDRFQSRHR
jgi:hypothetical protein